jgi:hypothetical protein
LILERDSSSCTPVHSGWMVSYVTILTEPRQHHILPAFYLAGFTDTGGKDGTLHVFDYARKRRYASKPEKVARERDFYRIYKPGKEQYIIEKDVWARLEGDISPVLRRVSETDMASPKELGTLLSLAAMVYVRGRRGLERAYLGVEEQMRAGLQDGTLTAKAWEEVRELHRLAGEEDPAATQITYEEARRRLQEEAWSPIAPRDYVLRHIGELHSIVLDSLMPDSRKGHMWSLAVANPDAGEFVTSDAPLSWGTALPWEPGYKKVERLDKLDFGDSIDNPNLIVAFPLNKKLALLTRPFDRNLEQRYFRYEATARVVAWVNTSTQLGSLGTLYSASEDFGLLGRGNRIGRSIDHFAHWVHLRRGAGLP